MATDTVTEAAAKLRDAIAYCDKAIIRQGAPGAAVAYRLKRKSSSRGTACLWGEAGGPVGLVVGALRRGELIVVFRAGEVRRACEEMLRRLET